MGRSHTVGMAGVRDLPPSAEGVTEPYSQGHWHWDVVSASSMWETRAHAWSGTHVDLSLGKMLNVVHTRTKSLD